MDTRHETHNRSVLELPEASQAAGEKLLKTPRRVAAASFRGV
jgi:hypothetical protein